MMKHPENCANGKHVKIQKAIKLNHYDVTTAGVGHMLSVLVYMKNQKYLLPLVHRTNCDMTLLN